MNVIKRPATALLLLLIALTATAAAQQKRQTPAKPQPKATPAPTPAPTFDTLLPADTYVLYGEIRGAGQVIRSSALNDLLEPILKLSGPPKEFRSMMKFLNAHADEVMSSRLMVAGWPNSTAKDLPDVFIAVEFASAEEATKFAGTLNGFLPTVIPLLDPTPKDLPKSDAPPALRFHLQRLGTLVVLTPKPWTMKQLWQPGRKTLSEDVNFRTARNRLSSEPIFVFFDMKAVEREDEERRKQFEAQEEERKKKAAEEEAKEDQAPEGEMTTEMTPEEEAVAMEEVEELQAQIPPEPSPEPTPDPNAIDFSLLTSALFSIAPNWPEAIGFSLSFEGDSFDLRALFVNEAGDTADAVPFLPMLMAGAPFTPEAPNIFPADTEMLATMSLDLPRIYAVMAKPRMRAQFIGPHGMVFKEATETDTDIESPFATIEQKLKINIKDDLLPLLGPEVAIRLPMTGLDFVGLPRPPGSAPVEKDEKTTPKGPAVAIAIKDLDAMRKLMPKLIDNIGFKGASSLAQTERREDTEIISYANFFSYAFVGNFLILSADPAITRHIVDSYLKHETLASDSQFRISTRWQPKPLNGQLYISPAMMESYKTWTQQPTMRVSDETRAFLVRASSMPQPITYSLSNDGLGPLHEVHIPRNLILMAVAQMAGDSNPPQTIQNERAAISVMHMIAVAEEHFMKTKGNGRCGTLEELIAADLLSKEMVDRSQYRFDVTVSGDKFEVNAVPMEYGKSGHLSLFIDQSRVLRGGDHNGSVATVSDPPLY
jgi:hypothetical protein